MLLLLPAHSLPPTSAELTCVRHPPLLSAQRHAVTAAPALLLTLLVQPLVLLPALQPLSQRLLGRIPVSLCWQQPPWLQMQG
jgi:hypothetical protein